MDKSLPLTFDQLRMKEGVSAPSEIMPWHLPIEAWKVVIARSLKETSDDNIGLIATGVSFYGFLAIVPLLGALVLSYGLIAEPSTVIANMHTLMRVMPADAAKLIGDQLLNIVKTSDGKKGFGLFLSLTLALFGARNGAGSIIIALNIAYEEKETRGFVRVNILALVITFCSVLFAMVAALAIAVLTRIEALLPELPNALLLCGRVLAYVAVLFVGAAGAGTLYRYAPSRQKAKWAWISPGSLLAGAFWLVITLGFGVYVATFGNYNATYGSLGAIAVLLTWLYLSSYSLLFGAELNCEFEREMWRRAKASATLPIALDERSAKAQIAAKKLPGSLKDVDKRKTTSPPSLLFDAGVVVMAFGIAWLGNSDRRG